MLTHFDSLSAARLSLAVGWIDLLENNFGLTRGFPSPDCSGFGFIGDIDANPHKTLIR